MKPKGIGYCHAMPSNWRALRRARELAVMSRGILELLHPMDRTEKKQLQKFKLAIERFEKADK